MEPTAHQIGALQQALEELGRDVLRNFLALRAARSATELAEVAYESTADTIYGIDHAIDEAILAWLEAHWPSDHPIELVMEGLEEPRTIPAAAADQPPVSTLIIDPLDGTREIMWDRRSAWFLAALAPHPRHRPPNLAEVSHAVMVELPPTRHRGSYLLSTCHGNPVRIHFWEQGDAGPEPARLTPYGGESLAHGFVSLGSPFYEGKAAIGRFAEAFLARYFEEPLRGLPIFDDQYLSTGGQLFDLMSGRLRIVGDLRPLFLTPQPGKAPLFCHPYDICTRLLAESLGCVVEAPDGSALDPPLDLSAGVAWIGYANARIADRARPIVRELLPLLRDEAAD